jgi:hypothetical protein
MLCPNIKKSKDSKQALHMMLMMLKTEKESCWKHSARRTITAIVHNPHYSRIDRHLATPF